VAAWLPAIAAISRIVVQQIQRCPVIKQSKQLFAISGKHKNVPYTIYALITTKRFLWDVMV